MRRWSLVKYDVFLSYSHSEAAWVENELWPELESPSCPSCPSFTCCLHTRDFLPGLPIPHQIISHMAASRGTLIVLSSSYISQHWTRLEWRQALRQAEQDRTKVTSHLIIIIIIIILIIIYRGWSFCFMGSYQKRILKTENYGIISSTETILIQMTATFGSNWGKTF